MKKLLLLTLVLVIALTNLAYACSPAQFSVDLNCNIENSILKQDSTCLNEDCSVNISRGQLHMLNSQVLDISLREEGLIQISQFDLKNSAPDLQQLLQYLDAVCVEDLTGLQQVFSQEIQGWVNSRKEYFLDGNLAFEPYSLNRESDLEKSKNDFGRCHYYDFKRAGGWLIVTRKTRDYCSLSGGIGGMCPSVTMSYTKYFGFLISHPNTKTLPHLAGFLIIIAVIMVFFAYLFKRKEIIPFFKPQKFIILFTIVLGIPISSFLFLVGLLKQSILWLIGCYVIACIVAYVYRRLKKR